MNVGLVKIVQLCIMSLMNKSLLKLSLIIIYQSNKCSYVLLTHKHVSIMSFVSIITEPLAKRSALETDSNFSVRKIMAKVTHKKKKK
jgi:hypothetical protein